MRTGFWVLTLPLTALILVNTLPYFRGDPHEPFLLEKGELARSPLWMVSFYYHLVGASICLGIGPLLLSAWILRRSRRAHRVLGWIYVAAVLCVASPSGIYLAFHAKGGVAGQTGFLVAGIAWFATTWSGLTAVRRGALREHLVLMTWSYALAWSAVSFRIFHVLLDLAAVDPESNYVVSLWLSLLASAAVAIWLTRPSRPIPTLVTRLGVEV